MRKILPNTLNRIVVCMLVILVAAPAAMAQRAAAKTWRDHPLNDEVVDQAVRKAVDYLWNKQSKEGHWELLPLADYEAAIKDKAKAKGINSTAGIYGGATSLVLLALLKSGEKPGDERYQKAIKVLKEVRPTQTYANALRAAVFASLDAKQYASELKYGRDWLLDAIYVDSKLGGAFGYNPPANPDQQRKPGNVHRDLSCTQYAALGMWLLSDADVEIPDKFWQLIQAGYLKHQCKDGGWHYMANAGPQAESYQSMTLGGLATLYIIWDKLYTQKCGQVPPADLQKGISGGLDWLAKHFSGGNNPGRPGWFVLYTMYGVERVGVASGLKYFGDKDWYSEAARYVLHTQRPDGSWAGCHATAPEPVTTAWALLFLSYGRAPVVFNKLSYCADQMQWNSRPRDLARLTGWMTKYAYEQLFSWQITPIDRPLSELLDAPILVMSGRAAIDLKQEDKDKLRDYMLHGGLLLGEAADGSVTFANSFRALAAELFPQMEMSPLPKTHPIYTLHYRLMDDLNRGGGAVPPLEGVSNGIRTLMLLSPRDIGCAWQRNEFVTNRRLFELGGNLMEYAADHGKGLVGRGTSYLVRDEGKTPATTATVGRLVWGAAFSWDPEPAAWQHADVRLRNDDVMRVATTQCDFKEPVDPKKVPIVHVTGTTAIVLTADQKANLKNYLTTGGMLLSDAAGGKSKLFSDSMEKLAAELLSPMIPATPDWLSSVRDKRGDVKLRHVGGLPRAFRPIQLLGVQHEGHWAMLHLPYDLTAGLVGNPNIEPSGLAPESAQRFVAALLKSLYPSAGPLPELKD